MNVEFKSSLFSLLRCNNDHTVRTSGTINCSCSSIFQYFYWFNIIGVHHRRTSTYNTVNHPKRITPRCNRTDTANLYLWSTTRHTVIHNLYTGSQPLQRILKTPTLHQRHFITFNFRNRPYHITAFLSSIGNHHHIINHHRVFCQCNIDNPTFSRNNFLIIKPHITKSKRRRVFLNNNTIPTIHISNSTIRCTLF